MTDYKDMLAKCDDIGADNPMAKNIYMCFVFLSIWKAADGKLDMDSFRTVVNKFTDIENGRHLCRPSFF